MGRKREGEPKGAGETRVTILHVSDMQFGVQHRFGRLGLGGADEEFDTLLKRLTDDLDWLRENEGLAPDLVALTGDLAEQGKPKEYDDVLAFCEGVQAHLKLGRDRILVIPGNHDINRALCASYFNECEGLDRQPVEPYWPKWKPYVDFFGELYSGIDRYEFKATQPYTWFELPELRVVVAGLNSTMRESHKEKEEREAGSKFGHYGHVGEAQLEWFGRKLDEAAAKGWLRIGLVHHNAIRGAELDDENLRDAPILNDRIGARLNLLLHGHTHDGSIGWLGRDLPVISTGSAAVKVAQRPEEVPNQYQIIQVHRAGIRRWARQYTPKERKWIGDPRVSKNGGDWRHEEEVRFPQTDGTFGAPEFGAPPDLIVSKLDLTDDIIFDRHMGRREPDDLLAQVMASCRVRDESGRVEPARVRSEGEWGDYCRVSDPARGTYLLGAHEGPLTVEHLDRWVKDVHDPFWSKGNRGRTSDLVIAAPEPIADDLRAKAGAHGVQLFRRLDYENVIDTERWKEHQSARLDRDREYLHELYIEQRVTLWSPVDDARQLVHGAADRIVRMLCEGDGCFVMVLGPAGTGKTFLMREVARRMTSLQSVITPIVVELRGLDRVEDVYQLVAWEFARAQITLPPRAFDRDLREGRIALLFDGFDELAIRVRSAAIPEHFARILGAARERARVIVASRAEHFVSQKDAVEALMSKANVHSAGLAGQLQAITQRRLVATQKFTSEDIEEYLGRALGSAEAGRARMQRFRRVHDLPGLAATPRMLSFLVRLTDEQLDAAAARRDAITSAELYRLVIVEHWLKQQEERLNPPGSAAGPTRDALLESATRLALHLWRSTAKSVAAAELDAHTGEQLRKLCEEDSDVARQMLQGRTLLIQGEGERFEFVHQTVMEWLVGQAVAKEIKATGTCADLEQGRLDDFLVDVLRELLGDAMLVAWAVAVLQGTPENRLAENARLALARMKRQATVKRADLRGQDLRGQSLEGQDLRGALLDEADLREIDLAGRDLSGASLKGAKLARANLRGANLAGANLEGADLSFARLDRAMLDRVRLSGASLLATRALGAKETFDRATGRFAESAAWEADARALWFVPADAECNAVAFSPDGRFLATGHDDGLLRIWDVERAVVLRLLEGHAGSVSSVSWSPDGRCLASGSYDDSVRLWEAATGKALLICEGHTNAVSSVSWSADGSRLASGSYDRTLRLWEAATGKALLTCEGHKSVVTSVSWSPNGSRLASGSQDKTVRLWETATGTALRTCRGHTNFVSSVSWSPDGNRVASGSYDKTVRLWDAATGKELRAYEGHTNGVTSVSWSPDGSRLASGSYDKSTRLWKPATGKLLRVCEGHMNGVTSVSWSPDGSILASGSDDRTVCLWEAATGKVLRSCEGHLNVVCSVSWSPDGNRIASGSHDKTVRLWEAATGKGLRTEGHTSLVMSVSWSPDGSRLASGSHDNSVRLWESATGKPLHTCEGHTNVVRSVSWSPDGSRLASGSYDNSMRLWKAATGKALLTCEGHTHAVTSVSWSPDDSRLASGSHDNSVRLWEAATGKALRTCKGHTSLVSGVSWSPDSRRLASGSYDKTVRLWETATGKALPTCEGHTSAVSSVSWSPDGSRLASGSHDTTVRLWAVATAQPLAVLRGHHGPVYSVSWSRDGRFVVSSGSDGTLRIWEAVSGRCLAVYVATPNGAVVYRPSDGHYRTQGDPAGRVAYTIGLARYELGELDEFVPGGLRLPDDEPLLPM